MLLNDFDNLKLIESTQTFTSAYRLVSIYKPDRLPEGDGATTLIERKCVLIVDEYTAENMKVTAARVKIDPENQDVTVSRLFTKKRASDIHDQIGDMLLDAFAQAV